MVRGNKNNKKERTEQHDWKAEKPSPLAYTLPVPCGTEHRRQQPCCPVPVKSEKNPTVFNRGIFNLYSIYCNWYGCVFGTYVYGYDDASTDNDFYAI